MSVAEHDVPDRRVRRTRRILRDALTSLILEKGYDHITVQDILDRADVGRSTFYSHFTDKEALLMACFDGVRAELAAEFTANPPGAASDPAGPVAALFQHAHRHRRVYKALCGRKGSHLVYRNLNQLIGDLVRQHLRPAAGAGMPVDLVAEVYASATVGLLSWWVDHDFRPGPARIAAMHEQLTGPGVRAALSAPPVAAREAARGA
jgi:AcrR family transcriptional regulator